MNTKLLLQIKIIAILDAAYSDYQLSEIYKMNSKALNN
jgi:hypothetical protein